MNWRISKRSAAVSGVVLVVLLVGVALVLWSSGWFGDKADTTVSPGQSPSPSSSPSPTESGTKPTESPGSTTVTVADLQKHLSGILHSTPFASNDNRRGRLVCDGSGEIGAGTAVRCEWQGSYEGSGGAQLDLPRRPVYVAVLDDSGRYTFQMHGADPDAYPKDTTDCRTLMAAPPNSHPEGPGLEYSTLLHYWMASGSPASMDDDGNGLPCETVYPANAVALTAASPLVPGNNPGVDHSVEDVQRHLEAVLSGLNSPEALLINISASAHHPVADPTDPAVTGTTFTARRPFEQGGMLVTVLADDGRYAYSHQRCCGWGPNVEDYPADASCKQLSKPVTDSPSRTSSWTEGLSYPFVVYFWMAQDSPNRMDRDGNGRPCEAQYPSPDVDRYFGSKLQP